MRLCRSYHLGLPYRLHAGGDRGLQAALAVLVGPAVAGLHPQAPSRFQVDSRVRPGDPATGRTSSPATRRRSIRAAVKAWAPGLPLGTSEAKTMRLGAEWKLHRQCVQAVHSHLLGAPTPQAPNAEDQQLLSVPAFVWTTGAFPPMF